jgi:hypothetical protein
MTSPTVLLVTLLCIVLIVAPRGFFFFPFVMVMSFVPMNQILMIGPLNFPALRILIIFGVLRLLIRNEIRQIDWNTFDKLIFVWTLIGSIIYVLQWLSIDAIINRLGIMFDILGIYWIVRHAIRNWADIIIAIKWFAFFAILTAPLIALEKFYQPSFFSNFGPINAQFHLGRFRCAGAFPHSIMLGVFWANLLPFFYARIKANQGLLFYWCAICSGLSNSYFSASSTPLLTVCGIIIFWKIYRYRIHGKAFFMVTCAGLFMLHLIMNHPVWHLMARVNVVGGSTGWHRYKLFDNFVKHTSEWFVLGAKSTSHWGYGMEDITNQFILEAVRGGFITLCLFCIIIYYAIKITGTFSLKKTNQEVMWLSWALCVSLLGHFVTFWGVSYFGQMSFLLYITFALVAFTLEESLKLMKVESV